MNAAEVEEIVDGILKSVDANNSGFIDYSGIWLFLKIYNDQNGLWQLLTDKNSYLNNVLILHLSYLIK